MGNDFQTLDADRESLDTLRVHARRTADRINSEGKRLAAFAPRYTAFLAKLDAIIAREQQIRDAMAAADACAYAADNELNRLGRRLHGFIHGGKKVDTQSPKHQLYFGNKTLGEAIRGILGPQLEMSRTWVQKVLPLETTQVFMDLLQPMTDAVADGDSAKQAQIQASADNAKFRLDGERRQIFDEYNALAAQTMGELVVFAKDHPELELPGDWPESFYIHSDRDPGPQSVEEVDVLLKALRDQEAKLLAKRAELATAAEAAQKAQADAAQADSDLDAAKQKRKAAKKEEENAAERVKAAKKQAKQAKKKK
jgi:hypothetical protein